MYLPDKSEMPNRDFPGWKHGDLELISLRWKSVQLCREARRTDAYREFSGILTHFAINPFCPTLFLGSMTYTGLHTPVGVCSGDPDYTEILAESFVAFFIPSSFLGRCEVLFTSSRSPEPVQPLFS
jgi:hypothetical protein